MKTNIIILGILFFSFLSIVGQQNDVIPQKKKTINKGKFFAYWGWNRASYTDSDIRFKGNNYDFTLSKVSAEDRQTKFSINNYLNPANITTPQTNYRIGYFFKENYTISIGVDHMKYVVNNDQFVSIDGTINIGNSKYDQIYTGQQVQLTKDFLRLEHTDGLNYINMQLYRFDDISRWFGLNSESFQALAMLKEGVKLTLKPP